MTFEIINVGAMITAVFIRFLTMSYIYTFKRSWPYLNVRIKVGKEDLQKLGFMGLSSNVFSV